MPFQTVREALLRLAETYVPHIDRANERHPHHLLTGNLQRRGLVIDTDLFPEWPTWKLSRDRNYARYRNRAKKLWPADADGSEAHIDFAVGPYAEPVVGLEMLLTRGWARDEVVGDFVKILDPRNPFRMAVSFTLILRQHPLSERGRHGLERSMQDAFAEALRRLPAPPPADRLISLIVTEMGPTGDRRHWSLTTVGGAFEPCLRFAS